MRAKPSGSMAMIYPGLKQGGEAPSSLLHSLGGGVAQFPDHPAEPCWTVLHCAPNLGRPRGRLLGMTQSNGLNQCLGGTEPKCVQAGDGTTGLPTLRGRASPASRYVQPALQHNVKGTR